MAKVTGPLLSLEASGTVGDALTFSRWVGRPYVRRYTVPTAEKRLRWVSWPKVCGLLGTV